MFSADGSNQYDNPWAAHSSRNKTYFTPHYPVRPTWLLRRSLAFNKVPLKGSFFNLRRIRKCKASCLCVCVCVCVCVSLTVTEGFPNAVTQFTTGRTSDLIFYTQNYSVFRHFPSSGILGTRKYDVSGTGSVSVLKCVGGRHLLSWVL
jgi:hypothetical protein